MAFDPTLPRSLNQTSVAASSCGPARLDHLAVGILLSSHIGRQFWHYPFAEQEGGEHRGHYAHQHQHGEQVLTDEAAFISDAGDDEFHHATPVENDADPERFGL